MDYSYLMSEKEKKVYSILKDAILNRKPIKFRYDAPDEVFGERTCNPYVVFYSTKEKFNLNAVQVEGVSKTKGRIIEPTWGLFTLEFINRLEIINQKEKFEIDDRYKPESKLYANSSIKLQI